MLNNRKIAIIGTGNMGEALASGLVSSQKSSPDHIICTDVRKDSLGSIKDKYGVKPTTNNTDAIK